MRVLHVLNTSSYSGAENVACQIIHMFEDEENMDMAYCSPNGTIKESLKERNINYYPVTKLSISELKRVIKEYKPTLIHAHDMKAGYIASKACGEIPLISHIHNNAYDSRGISLKAIAYATAAIKAKHIFWVSKSSFDGYAFHVFFKKKSSILYNIINIQNLYDRLEQDTKTYNYDVIYLGRLTYPKNPYRLLEVCKLLIEKKNNISIAIVGTGEMKDEIYRKAKKMDLLGNVSFLGFQSNPTKILFDSKVMLMTSLWEGTPMVALEAQALGVPIVSTPVDGMKDLITNGKTGFLSNDNEQLVDQIIKIVNSSSYREKISKNEKIFSSEYNNIEIYKKKILSTYMDVLK